MDKHLTMWQPEPADIQKTNIYRSMIRLGFETYESFWRWSVERRESFWEFVVETIEIPFEKNPTQILDVSQGVSLPQWLPGASFNIVDACFKRQPDAIAIIFQNEGAKLEYWTYGQLDKLVNRIANSLIQHKLQKGDRIAIDLSMHVEAIALYLAGIKAGLSVVTIADSFTPEEIAVRLEITQPKLVFTQDYILRNGKKLPLYEKVRSTQAPKIVVINQEQIELRDHDLQWSDFLGNQTDFISVKCASDDITTILFSSGTTSTPKAIPWTHTTPIKCASDGYFHQDIQQGDIVAWPTNLGWMMGPWLVFAALMNKASIGLYGGSPLGSDFGTFVQEAKVSILGVVPSIVKQWKLTHCMKDVDWNHLKCFSSTGEASNPEEYSYLMQIAGNKPIIEYCGGTEIGGGYLCSTLVQNNIPSTFSTKALGSDFVLLDENNQVSTLGEVFIIPPSMGLSNVLLNKDHHQEYYHGLPLYQGKVLRRHGDQIEQLDKGYFKAQGRVDDAMNLGGIKVSSLQIEEWVQTLDFVKESAAISVPPKEGGPEQLVVYFVPTYEIEHVQALSEINYIVKSKINPLFKVSDVVSIGVLPRTASGKVMRRMLRKSHI
ncbi:MAG: AMP-binding protein [Flavobacteriaceae bacterium]|nr:AMP-binding protein [Flavobacteriaceae bacterium]